VGTPVDSIAARIAVAVLVVPEAAPSIPVVMVVVGKSAA
jgi:hypothetical protein